MIFQPRCLGPVFTTLSRFFAVIALSCTPTTTLFAQSPAAGSNWEHLEALPTETRLHVSADKGGATCKLVSVDDATLVCGKHTFPRSEVKSVKLTRYGTSYAVGAAAGAGAGVGVGIALVTGGDGFLDNKKGEAAAIGIGIGGVIGALITGPADLFRGPTVYRRQ